MTDYLSKFDAKKLGIANHASRNPDKPALIINDETISFRELERNTNALANGLLQYGLKAGDRIAVFMYNCPELIQCWSAAAKIGITPIALNYRFLEDELAFIINNAEAKTLIYDHKFESIVEAAKHKFDVPSISCICSGGPPSSEAVQLDEILKRGQNMPLQENLSPQGVSSVLIYTSGTTGKPKGVFKTSKNRLNSLLGYVHTFESNHDDIHLVAGPLYHSAPYAWAAFSLMIGNPIVIMPRFDAEEFLRLIDKHQATTTFVVPTMLNRIVNLPQETLERYDTSSLRVMTMAGEACPFPLKKKAVECFNETRIFEFYGGTESSVVTYLRPEDQLKKPGSCGKPVLGSQFKLLDEKMEEVPEGKVGVLYVKSDFLMDGYYRNPKATEACYHDGYLTLGDMARTDEEGYFYIVDRTVDMVLSGGVNIYPAEIEEVLYDHPAIYDVAVIGAKDPNWGEKLVAYVVARDGFKINADEVIEYVGMNLASYKKPREVLLVDEIPYSPSGKQLKRVLRDEYTKKTQEQSANT